jgi:hypothetical protein
MSIHWLDTGAGKLTCIAEDTEPFKERMAQTHCVNEDLALIGKAENIEWIGYLKLFSLPA